MFTHPRRRFSKYREALKATSVRTGASLPSLIVSFGALHELTAIVPLVGVFYGARTLGIGECVIESITRDVSDYPFLVWGQTVLKSWIEEGDAWAARLGRRYGFFGHQRGGHMSASDADHPIIEAGFLADDLANAVFAYGVTKALLPFRIGASIYFAPMFSRGVVRPLQRSIVQVFRRKKP